MEEMDRSCDLMRETHHGRSHNREIRKQTKRKSPKRFYCATCIFVVDSKSSDIEDKRRRHVVVSEKVLFSVRKNRIIHTDNRKKVTMSRQDFSQYSNEHGE